MTWVIREYQSEDLQGCLSLIRSNTPPYFAEDEIQEFEDDLSCRQKLPAHKQWPYYVLVTNNQVRACGGFYIKNDNAAVLIWGMVSRSEHRRGLGTALLNYRLFAMPKRVRFVEIDTTPASFTYYRQQGFEQYGFEVDGYGPGLDKVLARKTLG